ncbi:MAG TPA: hypothetical protein DCS97_14365 [Planctomycetes bacterium]|nr:hypothetical protein [Planctomycetota bacterium]
MTRLADAITAITADCTTDEAAAIIGESRATTGRWLKDLRDTGDLGLWSARAVERLARYEVRNLGTTTMSDALRPEPAAEESPADPAIVRTQINKANRKNSSLMLELDTITARGVFDSDHARTLLQKTDAALRETAGQQSVLARWRRGLVDRLRRGR